MEKFNEKNKIFSEEQGLYKEQIREILKESPLYKELEEEGEESVEKEVERIASKIRENKEK